jgi:7-cyano-7-deazaguanine synthase
MKVLGIGNFTGGAILGTPSGEHDEMHSYAPPGSQVAPSWVPARNAIILSALAGLAYTRGIYIIGTGVNAVDWSGYFDCRPGFITRLEDALAWALGYEHSYPGFAIYAPLIQLSKKEIVEEGERLHVPWGMTWSCYEGKEKPCQKCGACKVRKIGFDAAGVVDPLLSTS